MDSIKKPETLPSDHAGIKFPPPLIYLIAYALGSGIQKMFPVRGFPHRWKNGGGIVFSLLGTAMISTSVGHFIQAKTTILPMKPTSSLVTSGVYRYTRNPMYVSFAAFYLAALMKFNKPWALLFLPPLIGIVQRYVIRREEQYLEKRFGTDYQNYRQKVRRWI